MNKRVKIAILIALLGVIALLALQALWITTSYKQEQKKLLQTASPLIERTNHNTTIENSFLWWTSIQNRYGKEILPYVGGINYEDSLVSIKVYNPDSGLYNLFERKCSKEEISRLSMGSNMLYHVCGLNLDQFNRQLDSVFHANRILIPYIVEKVDTRSGQVVESTHGELDDGVYTIVCDTLRLGITGTDGVVVKFDGSISGMFAQIRFILLSSLAITLLLAVVLFGIIRIVIHQQKLSEFREDFVRQMIHEIRNPIGYLKRMLEISSEKGSDNNLRTASKKIGQINLLIEKLLSTTSNRLKIQTQTVDLRKMLEEIVESFPDARISLEIAPDVPSPKVDPVHYGNALLNLVDNAVKYSPHEQRIAIRCYREKRGVCVTVKDRGIGIPLEYQFLVYDRYFRVPHKKSVAAPGFGLGLSYARMVAEAHGGTISFTSIYKQGSEFTIRVPYGEE